MSTRFVNVIGNFYARTAKERVRRSPRYFFRRRDPRGRVRSALVPRRASREGKGKKKKKKGFASRTSLRDAPFRRFAVRSRFTRTKSSFRAQWKYENEIFSPFEGESVLFLFSIDIGRQLSEIRRARTLLSAKARRDTRLLCTKGTRPRSNGSAER